MKSSCHFSILCAHSNAQAVPHCLVLSACKTCSKSPVHAHICEYILVMNSWNLPGAQWAQTCLQPASPTSGMPASPQPLPQACWCIPSHQQHSHEHNTAIWPLVASAACLGLDTQVPRACRLCSNANKQHTIVHHAEACCEPSASLGHICRRTWGAQQAFRGLQAVWPPRARHGIHVWWPQWPQTLNLIAQP